MGTGTEVLPLTLSPRTGGQGCDLLAVKNVNISVHVVSSVSPEHSQYLPHHSGLLPKAP